MESFDLVVIGAGWAGLAMAKTYHQLHPDRSICVLESDSTIGGVWSKDRLYPGLRTNNMLGTYEYPDFPMDTKTFGVKPGEHIPGEVVHRYFDSYAENFSIKDKIRYNSKVMSAAHESLGGWTLDVLDGTGQRKIFAMKLVVATGLTSEPFVPYIKGQDTFEPPIFHTKDFAQYADSLDSAKNVTVLGGMKSGWDAAYAYANKGIHVDWIIRSSGHGPAWMAPPYVTPFKKWLEKLVHTRFLTWFSPCIWGDADDYTKIRRFWHETAIGRAITDYFWSILGNDVIALNKYDAHPETAKLKPWSQAMFTGTTFSIMNYPTNFFDILKSGKARIHIADITALESRTVHLSDGTSLETDALYSATGWKHVPPLNFVPPGIDKELGIPHVAASSSQEPTFMDDLVRRADEEITTRFPRLKRQPVQNKDLSPLTESESDHDGKTSTSSSQLTPYCLYRFMVPPHPRFLQTRDIAFAGMLTNFSAPMVMPIQALWITAFFDNDLPADVVPPLDSNNDPKWSSEKQAEALERLQYETVLHARFGKWRYPASYGTKYPDFIFDVMPYVDMLLDDLGLAIYRKGGWFAEATEPYGPRDYKDLLAEWSEKQR